MYEMVCTINQDAGKILDLIGIDPEFLLEEARLRDVYLSKDRTAVVIFTRIGGGNRQYYSDAIEKLRKYKGYIRDYDDEIDSTYASFEYRIPANKLPIVVAFLSSSDTTTGGEKLANGIKELEENPDKFLKEHPAFKMFMDDFMKRLK